MLNRDGELYIIIDNMLLLNMGTVRIIKYIRGETGLGLNDALNIFKARKVIMNRKKFFKMQESMECR